MAPTEPHKRGRKAVADKRVQRPLSLNDAEWEKVEAARLRWTGGRMGPGPFLRALVLGALVSDDVQSSLYHDSGQGAIDEANDIAERMAELERQIAALNPPAATRAER